MARGPVLPAFSSDVRNRMGLSEGTSQKDGVVGEILGGGDLSVSEIRQELWKRDVSFVKSYDRSLVALFAVLGVVWLLPAIAHWSSWGFLAAFARLPRVGFPSVIIALAAVFFFAALLFDLMLSVMRGRQGGCNDMHETVVLVRKGPYRVIRHPGYLAEIIYFTLAPVMLSMWVPFTILAAICVVIAVAAIAYLIRAEDDFNLRKWGAEYWRYMEEVPAVNAAKALRRL
jgi:protein-S-isoprenylcysteine O-methyltransferase Ste14